jgi:hypothetical protein
MLNFQIRVNFVDFVAALLWRPRGEGDGRPKRLGGGQVGGSSWSNGEQSEGGGGWSGIDAGNHAATKLAGWSAARIQSKRRQGTSGGMRCCAALLLAAAGC